MTPPLSPAAKAVIQAAAVEACLAEWGPVNDPPCHPDDEGWNGCHLCVKRDLIAAAFRAAADQVVPEEREPHVPDYPDSDQIAPWHEWTERQHARAQLLAIATELEAQP